jgi:putative ABC transport system permease protein
VGVDARDLLSLRVDLPFSRYNPSQQVAFFRQAIERLQMLPGVQSASAASDIPVSTGHLSATGFRVLGQPEVRASDLPSTNVRVVAPGYFKALGIPLLEGRDFTDADLIADAPQVFVVNEAFAKKFFPVDDALSASISVFMQRPRNPFGRIVGIVGDVKEGTLRGVPQPTVFYNYRQLFFPGMSLFIRSQRARQLAREATQIIRDIDRNLPVVEVRMVEDAFAESLARERLNAIVSGAFAVCALLLASLGLYGLLAFVVTERRNEIGIRIALGAQASQVVRMIVKQGLRLILVGASLGLVAAFAASRYLESLLFGVTTHDPTTFAAVPALLLLVSLIAVIIPARRATRVNPIQALRED